MLSPQKTFDEKIFPAGFTAFDNVSYLKCEDPVYGSYIDPMASRRMSRIVKMGVCTAIKCLKDNNVDMPDAIITGTGLGCIEDTEKFLGSIYAYDEKLLNPTPFIQSTHNTVAGAIALTLKCNNYNTTYAHRGFSFETALQDTILMLQERPSMKILTGSFDEITPAAFEITRRLGMWKNHPVNSFHLNRYNNRGSLAGEGVAFFIMGGSHEPGDIAEMKAVHTFYSPENDQKLTAQIVHFLNENNIQPGQIDLLLLGMNGDSRFDKYYDMVTGKLFPANSVGWYKHLCGEYDTSSSFAAGLAAKILKNQQVPEGILISKKKPAGIDRILIYNQLRGSEHSLILLAKC